MILMDILWHEPLKMADIARNVSEHRSQKESCKMKRLISLFYTQVTRKVFHPAVTVLLKISVFGMYTCILNVPLLSSFKRQQR